MENLPDELVVRVAEFLDAGRGNSLQKGAYQRGLSSLSRLNKRFHRVVLPLLFVRPVLITPDQVEIWTKTYASFVDPFKRAAAGRAWPPKLFKPESLTCGPWYDFELPRTPDIFRELNVLSSLTHLSLFRVRLDTDFLPSLLGPGNSSRTALQDLQLVDCIPPTEPFDYERVLAFLLEASVIVRDTYVWEELDYSVVDLKDETGGVIDMESNTLPDREVWAEAVFRLGEEASVDFRLFSDIFPSFAGPYLNKFDSWPSRSPFGSLTTFSLQLIDAEQLCLILYTSNFPSLRRLTLHKAAAHYGVELYPLHFEVMRRSITATTPHDEPGAFLLPTSWDGAELFTISNNLQVPLEFGKPVPPLSSQEMKQFGEYGGPKLDLLDCREAEMVLYFD